MQLTFTAMMDVHLPACADILATTPLWRDHYSVTREKALHLLRQGMADTAQTLCVALEGEMLVGFAYYGVRGALFHGTYLRLLAVREDLRGQGLGKQIMAYVEQDVQGTTPHLFLLAAEDNTGAHRFYERLGYQHIGSLPGYVVPHLTEYIFWKRLVARSGI
ncbi:MAG: GNAT family N-acetyltransferase [Chloroflexota bacterium]